MKRQRIRSLRQFDDNGIVDTFLPVELSQFDSQAPRLHPNGRVALRIEPGWPTQNFSRYLILLQRNAGMIQRVFCQVSQQFAQRFRAMQDMTIGKPLYLLEALFPRERERVRYSHSDGEVTYQPILLGLLHFTPVTVSNLVKLYLAN